MFEQVNEGEFIQRFALMNRKENFSYEGRKALFEYFEQLEDGTGEKIEFDCIAICCDYNEYEDINEFRKEQEGYKGTSEDYEGEYKDLDAIREHTEVIEIPDKGFITQAF